MEKQLSDLDLRLDVRIEQRQRVSQAVVEDLDEKIDISWIFHDNALEGVVLSYSELKAAIDKRIISDVSLIPAYEEIKTLKEAIEQVRAMAAEAPKKRKGSITLDTLKLLHGLVTPDEKAKGSPYRKDNPLHRAYFHEIAQPDKIAPRMKKLVEWLDEDETQDLHPVDRAARAHFRLMAIYPWPKSSGKVSRLLMNYMLLRDGYPPAVIHSIERQRYYDALRNETAGLVPLVIESVATALETEIRFFEEFKEVKNAKRAS